MAKKTMTAAKKVAPEKKPAVAAKAPAAKQPAVAGKQPRVVAAVGAAARASRPGLGAAIERAMSDAVLQANREGISVDDSEELKQRMAAARKSVVDSWG